MLRPGQQVPLQVEKAAVGGRMIARVEGQVVLVAGAIPGERVTARIERVEKRMALAQVVTVEEASPDRRPGLDDPLCGGCIYSHITYARQLALKADALRDAFLRIGRIPLDLDIPVAASPEQSYRMRAKLHVVNGDVGFYREGSHELCDAGATAQLSESSLDAVRIAVGLLEENGAHATSVELTENIPGEQKALAIAIDGSPRLDTELLHSIVTATGIAGCVARDARGRRLVAGEPAVSDSLATLTQDRASTGSLHRHPESFFQSNRYLVPTLVGDVLDSVLFLDRGPIVDLYAGVGLFSVGLAAMGRRDITAVEGDRTSGADLARNAAAFGDAIVQVIDSVEGYLARRPAQVPTVIVDPPRTGMSQEALTAVARLAGQRLVYVSCDPATMARDARRLIDAGFRMESLRAFDLFPNTPHIESLGVFTR